MNLDQGVFSVKKLCAAMPNGSYFESNRSRALIEYDIYLNLKNKMQIYLQVSVFMPVGKRIYAVVEDIPFVVVWS